MKQLAKKQPKSLADFADDLQARGYYTFTRPDAQSALGSTDTAFTFAANRLAKKGRIVSPRRGFFVIVPAEYRMAGAPPASWFIDDLMKFHAMPYYVGLLSAAALHGAAHQQPQEFQIITSSPLRPIRVGREKIKFFTKKKLGSTPTEKINGATGFFLVSSPEATALDLIRYSNSAISLSHVATVLLELKEKTLSPRLVEAAKAGGEIASVQRLGYLLEYLKAPELTEALYKWVKKQDPSPIPLVPTRKLSGSPQRNDKWAIIINEEIEVDQ